MCEEGMQMNWWMNEEVKTQHREEKKKKQGHENIIEKWTKGGRISPVDCSVHMCASDWGVGTCTHNVSTRSTMCVQVLPKLFFIIVINNNIKYKCQWITTGGRLEKEFKS